MTDLKIRENKIKLKMKEVSRRDFIKYCTSLQPLVLHKNNGQISRYPETDRIGWIQKMKEFEEERADLTKKWQEYNISKKFFENFQDFIKNTKFPAMFSYWWTENSEYADSAHTSKNAYLTFLTTFSSENILYSFSVKMNCRNVINSVMIVESSENIYTSFCCINSYNIFFSRYIEKSSNIRFSTNLLGCNECLFCNNLQNQTYCIYNKQYNKEEYFKKKREILIDKKSFLSHYMDILETQWFQINTSNSTWSWLSNCVDLDSWYICFNLNKWKNTIWVQSDEQNENMYNSFLCWRSHDFFWVTSSWWFSDNIYIGVWNNNTSHAYYSIFLDSCSYCLGCIWLKNKSFCILNKQYTKEERFEKANEIFAQMDKEWTLWQFFPWSMNPFYFNDTAAYLIDDSFTKEEVTAEWYLRRDEEIKVDIPEWSEIIFTSPPTPLHSVERGKLSLWNGDGGRRPGEVKTLNDFQWFDADWHRQINPEILKKVIVDEKWNSYRIIKMEYDFLMKHWLPLPEIHRLDRIKLWFKFK